MQARWKSSERFNLFWPRFGNFENLNKIFLGSFSYRRSPRNYMLAWICASDMGVSPVQMSAICIHVKKTWTILDEEEMLEKYYLFSNKTNEKWYCAYFIRGRVRERCLTWDAKTYMEKYDFDFVQHTSRTRHTRKHRENNGGKAVLIRKFRFWRNSS